MSMFEFFKKCPGSLSNTSRWETYDVMDSPSVAEHSFQVAQIAYLIALHEDKVDENEVVKRALFHDLEESYTGDIPRFSKREDEEFSKKLDEVEEAAIDRALSESTLEEESQEEIKRVWKQAKDESPEGLVIKQADILSAVYEVYREVKKGNTIMREYKDVARGIEYAIEICEENKRAKEMLYEMLEELNWDEGFNTD